MNRLEIDCRLRGATVCMQRSRVTSLILATLLVVSLLANLSPESDRTVVLHEAPLEPLVKP